ncbi:MAG: lamin tail domain-containing protein, partial [Planctomycetales bacterium]|nr:lamin tail domain-containing protein [Planctomycetales bacterium]
VANRIETTVDIGLYSGNFSTDVLNSLRITEVAFIGHGKPEFIEVKNIGATPLDISDVAFTRGVSFSFSASALPTLFPDEHAVVVGASLNRLNANFDTTQINVAGIYVGDLDREETIELRSSAGDLISYLDYDDDWYVLMDDEYQPWTLTVIDEQADATRWNTKQNWRPSSFQAGSPGSDDPRATPDPGAVVINEVMTKTIDDFNDVIELYNTTDHDIDIGNWYLGDRAANDDQGENLMRYRIAPGTVIEAHGYLVFSRQTHFANPADPGTVTQFGLSSFGEGVHLIAADEFGTTLGYSDSAYFPATEVGQSFGRIPLSDGSSTFVVMSSPTIGGPNSAATAGALVIDQIMYHPDGLLSEEYVRVLNTTDADVPLVTELGSWKLSDGISYDFREAGMPLLAAHQSMIIVPVDPVYFRETYQVPNEVQVFGPYRNSLNNAGESIMLTRPGLENRDLMVDRVTYDNEGSWPVVANSGNVALNRIATAVLGDEPSNWVASTTSAGTHLRDGIFMIEQYDTLAAAIYGHNAIGMMARQSQAGDANGDDRFDSRDLVQVFQAGLYRLAEHATWLDGDWNGDGLFDEADLVAAFQLSRYVN